jgi:hypothetical protein
MRPDARRKSSTYISKIPHLRMYTCKIKCAHKATNIEKLSTDNFIILTICTALENKIVNIIFSKSVNT